MGGETRMQAWSDGVESVTWGKKNPASLIINQAVILAREFMAQ